MLRRAASRAFSGAAPRHIGWLSTLSCAAQAGPAAEAAKAAPTPVEVPIPLHRLEFHACRSSGPGGQNVNKVNTKAELRVELAKADWIPPAVMAQLVETMAPKINREGVLVLRSQEHRTLERNRAECVARLSAALTEAAAAAVAVPRQMYTEASDANRAQRREQRRFDGVKKERRQRPDLFKDM
jgi:peptidyl-tRNA hydrolase ICT1